MGMIDRFGRIADTYVREKSSLLESEQERRRVHMGHAFWPTEVLHYTVLLIHLPKQDSFSQIGMFYSPMDILDGENIYLNSSFQPDLSESSSVHL